MKIQKIMDSSSPCLACHVFQETAVRHIKDFKQGEKHFKCDLMLDESELNQLKCFYNSLGSLILQVEEAIGSNEKEIITQKVERMTYMCLRLLVKLKAWEIMPECPCISQYPNGIDKYDVEPEKVRLFMALKTQTSDTEPSQECLKRWETHVISKALNLLWYLNTRLLSRKRKIYKWMKINVKPPEYSTVIAPAVHIALTQKNTRAKQLMLSLLDNSIPGKELKNIANISPDSFCWANNVYLPQAFVYYNTKSLSERLNVAHHQLVFMLIPIFAPPDTRKPWLAAWRKRNERKIGRLIDTTIHHLQHDCHFVYLFEDSQTKEMCQNSIRLLSKNLKVKYSYIIKGDNCSLLEELLKIAQSWKWKPIHSIFENLWQGWSSAIWAVNMSRTMHWLTKGIYMMAMQLANPPDVSPFKKCVSEPVTIQDYPEEYKKTLEEYFDIGEMFKKLAAIFNVQEKSHPLMETLSQSKYSYEPVHGDLEHGFNFHQAHNTALFLNIVSLVVRCLRDGIEEPDLIQFRKDVRALTARLDFKAKDRINNKKAHPRGNYKKKELKDVVKKAVSQLLSKSKTGKH